MTDWTEETLPEDYHAVCRAVRILHEYELRDEKPYPLVTEVRHLLGALAARFRDVLESGAPGSAAMIATARDNVHGWAEGETLARKVIRSHYFRAPKDVT